MDNITINISGEYTTVGIGFFERIQYEKKHCIGAYTFFNVKDKDGDFMFSVKTENFINFLRNKSIEKILN